LDCAGPSEFPDFSTPLNLIAESTEKIAGIDNGREIVEGPRETVADIKQSEADVRRNSNAGSEQGYEATAGLTRRKLTPVSAKGLIFAESFCDPLLSFGGVRGLSVSEQFDSDSTP
jgi:hypothetical protein